MAKAIMEQRDELQRLAVLIFLNVGSLIKRAAGMTRDEMGAAAEELGEVCAEALATAFELGRASQEPRN